MKNFHVSLRFLVCLAVFSTFILLQNPLLGAEQPPTPILYLFWGDGCPHCEDEREFLDDLQKSYPDLEMRLFEVWNHPKYAKLADTLRKAADIKTASVPMTFIGDWNLVGFRSAETSGVKMIEQIEQCLKDGCKDVLDTLGPQMIVEEIREDIAKGEIEDWERIPAQEKK